MRKTTNEDILKTSTVYVFHVPSINAIKVGFGVDGRARMKNYSNQYSLTSSAVSLKEWKIPSTSIASAIEAACHRALIQADFHRVSLIVDEREAKELFDLGHHSYEDAVVLVAEAIEETINSLYAALGTLKPASEEKARQKKIESNKRRAAIREEKRIKKAEDESQKIDTAIFMLKQRWGEEIEPFISSCEKARAIHRLFPREQGVLDSLFNGKKSNAYRMLESKSWPLIKKLVPEIYHKAKQATLCFQQIYNSCGYIYIERALDTLIGRNDVHKRILINTVKKYDSANITTYQNVLNAVMCATGLSQDDSIKLIKMDNDLSLLTIYAEDANFTYSSSASLEMKPNKT